MADVAGAIQSAIEIVQRLRSLSKKIEDAEFKMLLADLSSDLADAKLEAANLKFEIAKLKEDLHTAQAVAEAITDGKPVLKEGAYSFSGEEGAFCTACFDVRRQRVRLTRLAPPFDSFGKWECPSCKAILW